MKKYIEILKKCALFQNIDEEKLPIMLKCLGAKVLSFDRKYTVLTDGEPARYIGIVLSGSVQIVQIDYFGNRSIIGNLASPGVFNEAFACAETQSVPVTVIANEPSEIMLIECSHILHTCSNNCGFHQQLIFNLMKDLANKSIMFHQRIEITSKRTTREKLLAYLLYEAQKQSRAEFRIPFNRQELADYLEVDRSGLSAEISKLRAEGILESNRNHFKLLQT